MGMSWRLARFATLVFGVGLFFVAAPRVVLAAPHNINGWAWSGTTGWISVDCNGDPTGCAGAAGDYGLDMDASGNITGWAWSSQAGWICFGATCDGAAGVPAGGTPSSPAAAADHYCPGFVPCARYDANDGELHGWAYVISQTDGTNYRGWISLNCTDVGTNTASPRVCAGSDYAVSFDEDATQAAGEFYGYGWNGNGDATGNGWVQLGCGQPQGSCVAPVWGVTSGWVDTGWTSMAPIEGVYQPWAASGSGTWDIPLAYSQFSSPAGATLRCVFRMSDNTYRTKLWSLGARRSRVSWTEYYTVSSTNTPPDAVVDSSGNPVLWSFSSFAPDPPFGCEIQGNPPKQKVISNRIAVHPPSWTFAGAGGANSVDSIRAKYCLDGNASVDPSRTYFLNTDPTGASVQCDTEGDLAYTLLRARGVPVELKCYDNIDNDANFQRDCAGGAPVMEADRTCRGITYLCITHPPASAPQPPRP